MDVPCTPPKLHATLKRNHPMFAGNICNDIAVCYYTLAAVTSVSQ